MYSKARNFGWFVARNCREYPSAERTSAVSLVKVPDFNLRGWVGGTKRFLWWSVKSPFLCFRLLWTTKHLQEGLFLVRPAPQTRGCYAASVDRDASPATCRPEKMSAEGTVTEARFFHPYVIWWGLRIIKTRCLVQESSNFANRNNTTVNHWPLNSQTKYLLLILLTNYII